MKCWKIFFTWLSQISSVCMHIVCIDKYFYIYCKKYVYLYILWKVYHNISFILCISLIAVMTFHPLDNNYILYLYGSSAEIRHIYKFTGEDHFLNLFYHIVFFAAATRAVKKEILFIF